jgi:UDP-3-O-acyl-N-acetylglucosamine deacetylase
MTVDGEARWLEGSADVWARARARWAEQPVDLDLCGRPAEPFATSRFTIAEPQTVSGPGTFFGRATRTVRIEPHDGEGWWIDRSDIPDALPTRVSVRNVWTTGYLVSNIVLRSGPPHNYVRVVEHLVAMKLGLGIDSLMVRIDSGDPPLFDRGSLDFVEAIERGGRRELPGRARYLTVKEPVAMCAPNGAFLVLRPPSGGAPRLLLDVAIDFPNAIGRQRIRFVLDRGLFRQGAVARTNTSSARKLYCQTVGRLFADVRHLGYTKENVLVAGRRRYHNEPRLIHEGKALEAAWHRAVLDLLAALALVEEGRFVGDVVSYKSGHALDVRMVTRLYRDGLLEEVRQ